MIKKTILQGILLLVLFISLFCSLAQVDFVSIFKVQSILKSSEHTLGDLIWKEIEREEEQVTNDSILQTLDDLIMSRWRRFALHALAQVFTCAYNNKLQIYFAHSTLKNN